MKYNTISIILLSVSIILFNFLVHNIDRQDTKKFNNLEHRVDALEQQMQKAKSDIEVLGSTDEVSIKPSAILQGKASVYSEAGCLGCSTTLTMANGEKLDDDRATLALPCSYDINGRCSLSLALGTKVRIVSETGRAVVATVTDSGGFKKYGRVADLSLATAKAIGCHGLCNVRIEKI